MKNIKKEVHRSIPRITEDGVKEKDYIFTVSATKKERQDGKEAAMVDVWGLEVSVRLEHEDEDMNFKLTSRSVKDVFTEKQLLQILDDMMEMAFLNYAMTRFDQDCIVRLNESRAETEKMWGELEEVAEELDKRAGWLNIWTGISVSLFTVGIILILSVL